MTTTVWDRQRVERERLVGYLRTLPESAWDEGSLCPDYRVRDVVAHLIAGARSTPPRFLADMVTSRFDFHAAMRKALMRHGDGSPAELVARLERAKDAKARPGVTLLGEIVVHSEDIRRPLGAGPGDYDPASVRVIADAYVGTAGPVGAKPRIAGLRLRATDADWSTGDGPEASGVLLPLVLAMAGRKTALADLSGPGVGQLAARD